MSKNKFIIGLVTTMILTVIFTSIGVSSEIETPEDIKEESITTERPTSNKMLDRLSNNPQWHPIVLCTMLSGWIKAWRKHEMNEGRGREEHEILVL